MPATPAQSRAGVATRQRRCTPGMAPGDRPCLGVPVGVPRLRPGPVDDFGPVRPVRLAHRRRGDRQTVTSDATLSLAERSSLVPGRGRPGRQAAALASRPATSTRMPGPMVDGDRQVLEVLALRGARAGAVHGVHQRGEVVQQHVLLEAGLAERDMDDAALVDLELDAAGLDLLDRALEIEGDRARLGVRHQAAAAKDAAEASDHAHHVRRGERDVEVQVAGLDLLHEVLAADLVGAGVQRLTRLVALREHKDADGLAHAMRQHDGAAAPSGRRGADPRRGGCAPRRTGRSSPSRCP